jgi:60 kDa SS-A/Ro ribonucleoprotein
LAQLAATGCFQRTYYADSSDQLDQLLSLVDQIDDDAYLARLAVYARQRAYMRDMPAALLLVLSRRDPQLMHQVFDRVIDNGRMLRTMFQMIRSGQFGRRSLSSSLQRAFQRWLNRASVGQLLSASIGSDPSLRDVLRMARPRPTDDARRAMYGWLTDRPIDHWAPATGADLPHQIRLLQAYRQADSAMTQVQILSDLRVRWDLLADAALGRDVWRAIAQQMGPQALRMNLNTLARHGVFTTPDGIPDTAMVADVAGRIADADQVQRSRQFPYQYLAAYLNATTDVPQRVRAALHQAAEVACGNTPRLPGPVVVGLDVSGSMSCPATGWQGRGSTSQVRCVHVAALFAAAILRRNPDSVVIPFDTRAYDVRLDPQDTILSLSERLAGYCGGGTDCSVALRYVNQQLAGRRFAGCVLVSDNQSWVGDGRCGSTAVMTQWQQFAVNQRRLGRTDPRLICIDIQPYGSTQAPDRDDILNIGGFSDAVFDVVGCFLSEGVSGFVTQVESIEI